MLTQKSAIEKVRRFARQISDSGVPLDHVILYGSYSRNTQRAQSDIDVALVSKKFRGAAFFDIDLFGKTVIKKDFEDIQLRTYNTKDFDPKKNPFVEEILKTGIEIKA